MAELRTKQGGICEELNTLPVFLSLPAADFAVFPQLFQPLQLLWVGTSEAHLDLRSAVAEIEVVPGIFFLSDSYPAYFLQIQPGCSSKAVF